jgi:gas vesicle protein
MAENINQNLAEKIEKLIVDGNTEVKGYIDKKIDEVKVEFRQEINGVKQEINGVRQELGGKIETVYKSLKNEIVATATAVTEELKDEIKRVEDKLDKHLLQPV